MTRKCHLDSAIMNMLAHILLQPCPAYNYVDDCRFTLRWVYGCLAAAVSQMSYVNSSRGVEGKADARGSVALTRS